MTGNESIRGCQSIRKFKNTVKSHKTLGYIIKAVSYVYEKVLGSVIFDISDEEKTIFPLGELLSYK